MERKHEQTAKQFVEAIKTMAEKPANLDNLELYLSMHFPEWLQKYANTPRNDNRRINGICQNGGINMELIVLLLLSPILIILKAASPKRRK